MESFVAAKKRVPTKLRTPLAHSFGFDYGDLQDNRSGFISHWQKKRLRWYLLSYTISIFIWICLAGGIPMFIFADPDAAPFFFIPIIWGASVLAVFGAFWIHKCRAVYLDLRRGKVAELVSEVKHIRTYKNFIHKHQVEDSRRTHYEMDYYMKIGHERFRTTREQMQAFTEGLLYHIYLAPESRQILSASPVTDEEMDDPEIAFLYEKRKSNGDYTLVDDDRDSISTKGKR